MYFFLARYDTIELHGNPFNLLRFLRELVTPLTFSDSDHVAAPFQIISCTNDSRDFHVTLNNGDLFLFTEISNQRIGFATTGSRPFAFHYC